MPIGDLAEVFPCEIEQFIGITIAAGKSVPRDLKIKGRQAYSQSRFTSFRQSYYDAATKAS